MSGHPHGPSTAPGRFSTFLRYGQALECCEFIWGQGLTVIRAKPLVSDRHQGSAGPVRWEGWARASSEAGDRSGHPPWGPSSGLPEAGSSSSSLQHRWLWERRGLRVPEHQLSEPVCLQETFSGPLPSLPAAQLMVLGWSWAAWGRATGPRP